MPSGNWSLFLADVHSLTVSPISNGFGSLLSSCGLFLLQATNKDAVKKGITAHKRRFLLFISQWFLYQEPFYIKKVIKTIY